MPRPAPLGQRPRLPLTADEYLRRAEDLIHNEGAERFEFAPRLRFEDEPDVIALYAQADSTD